VIDLYARLLARCSTVNQINRVHIALTERMTPLELHDLVRAMSPRSPVRNGALSRSLSRRGGLVSLAVRRLRPKAAFPRESYEWVDGLADWAARSGKTAPEAFVRRRVKSNVFSLSNGAPTSQKSLVICFTGVARRLFMPIPVFLQHLSADRFDLLVLRDPSRHGYRNGVAGVADDFEGLVREVGTMFDRDAYRSVVTYGTSGGGLPAIVTALRLGLDKGVSVSGKGPLDPRWQSICDGGVGAMLRELVRTANGSPNLLLVHGAGSEPDADAARSLAQFVPVSTLVVHGREGQKIGHNAVFPLLLESRLGAFLECALDPGVVGFDRDRELTCCRIEV
jgi:hypothetical protein